MTTGNVTELFTSLQGEGVYAGVRQIFIRLHGCNVACRFCDTRPVSYQSYEAQALLQEVTNNEEPCHSIAITGGEPLLQEDFLKELLPLLKGMNKKIYLETNGMLPEPLKELIDYIDIIAMDVKLPSATGLSSFWETHRAFLDIAHTKEVFVKAVVTADTTKQDIEAMRDMIAAVDPRIALVLQPVTPHGGAQQPAAEQLTEFQKICCTALKTVKVIPQLHILAGIK
jgi:organic radical activating enzyme